MYHFQNVDWISSLWQLSSSERAPWAIGELKNFWGSCFLFDWSYVHHEVNRAKNSFLCREFAFVSWRRSPGPYSTGFSFAKSCKGRLYEASGLLPYAFDSWQPARAIMLRKINITVFNPNLCIRQLGRMRKHYWQIKNNIVFLRYDRYCGKPISAIVWNKHIDEDAIFLHFHRK